LGTHVFTAVAAAEDSGAMKWVAVTIPGQARLDSPATPRGAKRTLAKGLDSDARGAAIDVDAAAALDRITFSDEVLGAISAKLWTGASLIISDYGLSGETGKGTDFVVLTK
jgi:hypothetical protein